LHYYLECLMKLPSKKKDSLKRRADSEPSLQALATRSHLTALTDIHTSPPIMALADSEATNGAAECHSGSLPVRGLDCCPRVWI
jgi:hypothetical protein